MHARLKTYEQSHLLVGKHIVAVAATGDSESESTFSLYRGYNLWA